MPVDVREFRTTSTPRAAVRIAHNSVKWTLLELRTRLLLSHDRSRLRFLSLPAVAKKCIPREDATWDAARPTPPVAVCTRTDIPPLPSTAFRNAALAVRKIVGMDAAST